MAQTIKLKRSSVSGNVPTPAQLELGEVAINTFDGKVFIKKDNGSESVIEVGALSGGASSLLDLTDVVSDGTFGQFLTTDGNGSFSFTSASGADAIPYIRSAVSATAGQTVFPISYAIGFVDVYLNGVKLTLSTDYSATNGSSVTLLSPASSGDTVELVAYNGTPIEQVSLFTVSRYNFIAGNGQTTFTSYDENARNLTYTPNAIDVYLNGVLLTDSEFTATTGSSVVLTAPASTGDIIRIIDYGTAAIETGASYATNAFVDSAIAAAVSNLIDTAPATLDTLNELAAALGDDADFAGTVTTSLAAKANSADLATVATTGAYSDLTGTPTIPADVSDLTDTTSLLGGGGGSFEAVASGSISDGAPTVLNADGTVAAVAQEVTTSLLQTLNNPNPYGTSADDNFGYSVAVSGDYAIVGAYQEDDAGGDNSGKAYIFNATTGTLLHTLNNPNAYGTSAYDAFGFSVAISDTHAIVGAYQEDDAGGTGSGKAYIFNVSTGALLYTLDNPNAYGTSENDYFGRAVGISGNYAIVGAILEDDPGDGSGKAYIFNVTTGALVHTLNNPNPYSTSANDEFGYSVAISENYAIVNASFEDDAGGEASGKAYIFNVTTGALVHTLDNPNAYGTSDSDWFGWSVGISGNYAIIGAYQEDDASGLSSGKAYIYNVTTGALINTIDNPNAYGTSQGDYFGYSVAISENYTIVGAYFEDDAGGNQSGKAYIYSVPVATTTLTAENYAGIADAAYADGETATIQTAGSVDDAQSGLTPGQAYYVQANGTLGLTPDTPSVFAGTAVSATKLLIGKEAPAGSVAYADVTGTPDLSSYASTTYVDTAVSNLVDTAPAALDTLNELAAALGDDANFAGTVTTSLAAKANTADLATVATTGAYSDLTGTPTIPADVSDLTDTTSLLGGGGGSFEAVASGSLSDGSTVVLNADGTVSVVEESVTVAGPGIPAVFENASIQYTSATFDSANNKVVIAYQDEGNSYYGTAIVGTVSGKSISFGSPVVFESSSTAYISTTFDSANNKVVIAYRDEGNSYYGTAIVGTVSDTSISFGSPVVFKSATTSHISATFDSANNKIVISYSATYGRAVVGTVSGTSISFGSEWTFVTGTATDIRTTFDSNSNKIVISYKNSSNYLLVGVGTVSDTSISFGSFSSLGPNKGGQAVTFDSANNKIVITYTDGDNSYYGTARVGTVSGTSISFGTPVVFKNSATSAISATFDSISNKIVISHKDGSNPYYDYIIVGTVSDTSISFGSPYTFSTTGLVSISTYFYSATFDSENNKVVIAYADRGNSEYGTAVVFDTLGTAGVTNLTAENYVGISNAAYSDASTATIQTVGSIDDAQSGLTTGQAYYVQPNGTLATTPGTPSVFAGTAVSATKLLIGKEAPAATVAYADLTGNPANLVTAGTYSQGIESYITKQYVLNGTTTDATEGELLIAGTTSRISVPVDTTVLYEVSIVARRTDITGESASWHLKGCADNFSDTVSNVGNIYEIAVAADDVSWAVDTQADDTNNALNILVTGAAGKTIRWTAVVKTIEVSE